MRCERSLRLSATVPDSPSPQHSNPPRHVAPPAAGRRRPPKRLLRRHRDLPQPPLAPPAAAPGPAALLPGLRLLPPPLPAPVSARARRLRHRQAVPFPAFLSRVRALAASLRDRLGVSRGDVAFVLAPPSLHVPVLYYALKAVGAVVSPANPALTAGEISHLVELSNPAVAFSVSGTAAKLPPGVRTVFLLDSPAFLSFLQEPGDGPATGTTAVIRQSDPAAILYSSGTSGRAKAVLLTHRNIVAWTAMASAAKTAAAILLTVPMFHVYGFVICLRSPLAAQTLVLHTASRFDARAVLAAAGRFRVTHVALAPPSVLAVVRAAEEDETVAAGMATVQAVNCGGASVAPDLTRRFLRKFPRACLLQGYGLTETSGFCRAVDVEDSRRIGSVGRLSWGAEAKIVDPATWAALPPGVAGELWVRGPFVMKGFLGDVESTSAILDPEGWLRTGDLCSIDKDGFLFVVDRLKELIKYKGYQVAPAELEHLLQTHPDIVEAAVVPFHDDQAGELPVAFVVRRDGGNVGVEQIKAFVAKQVVHYKRIHHVLFVNTIPKNAGGKILRKDLVKSLASHRIRSNSNL